MRSAVRLVMLASARRAAWPLYGASTSLRRASGEAGKWKKRNVALTVSYLGTRFHGLQYWPTSSPEPCTWPKGRRIARLAALLSHRLTQRGADEAVENVVEGAAYRAGCIAKDNFQTPSKIGLMRACRTDRGVHAARNVLRMKVRRGGSVGAGASLLTDGATAARARARVGASAAGAADGVQ